jgi:hypothetical protein
MSRRSFYLLRARTGKVTRDPVSRDHADPILNPRPRGCMLLGKFEVETRNSHAKEEL